MGRNCASNPIGQYNATLGTFVSQRAPSQMFYRLCHLERNETSNDLTQRKTVIGQYCV